MSGYNLIVSGGVRQCRICKNRRRRKGDPYTPLRLRANEPGKLLARGALDYDRPVTVRCAVCAGVFERPLSEIGAACPHCGRYAEAVA
jgi:hypothetical protein